VPEASHLVVANDARPGRILPAERQVMSVLQRHYSYIDDFVSHPNNDSTVKHPPTQRVFAAYRGDVSSHFFP